MDVTTNTVPDTCLLLDRMLMGAARDFTLLFDEHMSRAEAAVQQILLADDPRHLAEVESEARERLAEFLAGWGATSEEFGEELSRVESQLIDAAAEAVEIRWKEMTQLNGAGEHPPVGSLETVDDDGMRATDLAVFDGDPELKRELQDYLLFLRGFSPGEHSVIEVGLVLASAELIHHDLRQEYREADSEREGVNPDQWEQTLGEQVAVFGRLVKRLSRLYKRAKREESRQRRRVTPAPEILSIKSTDNERSMVEDPTGSASSGPAPGVEAKNEPDRELTLDYLKELARAVGRGQIAAEGCARLLDAAMRQQAVLRKTWFRHSGSSGGGPARLLEEINEYARVIDELRELSAGDRTTEDAVPVGNNSTPETDHSTGSGNSRRRSRKRRRSRGAQRRKSSDRRTSEPGANSGLATPSAETEDFSPLSTDAIDRYRDDYLQYLEKWRTLSRKQGSITGAGELEDLKDLLDRRREELAMWSQQGGYSGDIPLFFADSVGELESVPRTEKNMRRRRASEPRGRSRATFGSREEGIRQILDDFRSFVPSRQREPTHINRTVFVTSGRINPRARQ